MENINESSLKETREVTILDNKKKEDKGTKMDGNYINDISDEKIQDSSISQKSNEDGSYTGEVKFDLESSDSITENSKRKSEKTSKNEVEIINGSLKSQSFENDSSLNQFEYKQILNEKKIYKKI